ncbi:hypothetical protein SVAN01_11896 [Stagonosporopsis vannaccii]|nr:hypothetical protein SVAN01_11896 [Stagonosporopsis vannaccii]
MLPYFLKLTVLLFLAFAVTALPAASTSLGIAARLPCESVHALCLRNNGDAGLCRSFVCSSYSDECPSCQTRSAFADFTATDKDKDMAVLAAVPPSKCIIVCAHAWCRPICSNPPTPHSKTADNKDAAASPGTSGLLIAQAEKLGISVRPGTITVVLGDPQVNRCAWLCSGASVQCREKCWAEDVVGHQPILSGGAPPEDMVIDGGNQCQVVDRGEHFRAIVCAVPEADIEPFTGEEFNWDNTQCTLYDREIDGRLWLACRRV